MAYNRQQLQVPSVPNLPVPSVAYSRDFQSQNNGILKIFFIKLMNAFSSLTGPTGGSYINTPYGAFQSFQDQSISVANTAYAVTFDTTDYSNTITLSNNSRINVSHNGIYNFQWSGQLQNTDTQLHDVTVWLRKNGTDVAGSSGQISIPNSHGGVDGHTIVAWNYFLELNANDYIELWWSATSTNVSLEFYSSLTSPTRPTAASVIATMNFVSSVAP